MPLSEIPLARSIASWHFFVRLDIVSAENSFPTKFDMMWDMVDGGILLRYIWMTNFSCSGVILELDPFSASFFTGGWWEYSMLLANINHQWFVIVSMTTFSWNLQWYWSIAGILPPLWPTWNGVFDFSSSWVSITFITFSCCFVFFVCFFLSHFGMTLTICCWFGVCCLFTVSHFMPFLEFIPSVKETFLAFLFNHPQLQTITIHFVPFRL